MTRSAVPSSSSAMRARAWLAAVLVLLAGVACQRAPVEAPMEADASAREQAAARLPLIPLPAETERRQGGFVVDASTRVVAAPGDAAAQQAARQFVAMLRESTGTGLRLAGADAAGAAIVFASDPALDAGDEGYALEVGPGGVRITARGPAGLFYGGVSLWQLLTADERLPVTLPALRIRDQPRFAWRGFMLDSARHMQDVEQIKRLLDQMARHKLNVFHWHLTDDQGWRLQIRRYPRLTEVGAWRTPAGKAGQGADGRPVRYGGFYTQEQAREIVDYAAKLHITVVPEIEMPGHAQAAIAAYPELGATGQAPPVSPDWGVHTWLFNVEDPTFDFLQDVLTEVMQVFPGKYIHIGGDEADKYQWQRSPQVQERRRVLGLRDDMALQSWFVERIERFLVANDRRLIGWDEILEGGLPPEATVMSWRGTRGAVEAARQGHDVVLSPSDVTYLNRMQSEEADEPPGHDYPTPLKAVYEFEPVPAELTAEQTRHVLGAQANLWTEHVRTGERVEHMAFPRLSALAEVAWSPKASRDFGDFLHRLAPQMRRFDRAGIRAADSAFAVRFEVTAREAEADTVAASGGEVQVALSNQAGFGQIRYTLDGSTPDAQSPLYTRPLRVAPSTQVIANAFADGQVLARPRSLRVDVRTLLSRDAEKLPPCRDEGLVLRLEDDEPQEGERAVVPVDIGGPCWLWTRAPLRGIAKLRASVVDLPYNFQFGGESARARPVSAAAAPVALQVFEQHCEGTPIASAPVEQTDAAVERVEVALPPRDGPRDLCLRFSGDHRQVLWAIDSVELVPSDARW